MLKIATWNINGIRSFSQSKLKEALDEIDSDIVCLQETKITRDVIDEQTATFEGYHSFFSFSKIRSGYSGVVTICKHNLMPVKAEEGLSGVLAPPESTDNVGLYGTPNLSAERLKQLDSEGRAVVTQFQLNDGKLLSVINVYCPRADPDRYEERLSFKLDFYHLLECRAQALRAAGSHVIILGDLNTSHQPIDHCDPGDLVEFKSNLGRLWMDRVIVIDPSQCSLSDDSLQLLDSFRLLNPNRTEAFTCWNTQKNARSTNYGTRIDYLLFTPCLVEALRCADILPEVHGSDHCPVRAEFQLELSPAGPAPSLCSKFLFQGRQQKLLNFFNVSSKPTQTTGVNQKQNGLKSGVRKQTNLMSFVQKKRKLSNEEESGETSELKKVVPPANSDVSKNKLAANAWKSVLSGPRPAPMCSGHNEVSVVRTVKKEGPNFNQQFYCCARGEGRKDNPESRCNFFQWATKK